MTQVEFLDAAPDRAVGYKVDVSRGGRVGRVWSEWFSRPADERYLSLSEQFALVHCRTERSRTRTVESAAIRVDASRDNAELLPAASVGETCGQVTVKQRASVSCSLKAIGTRGRIRVWSEIVASRDT